MIATKLRKVESKTKKIILFLPRPSNFADLSAALRKVEGKTKKKILFLPRPSNFADLSAALRKVEGKTKKKILFLPRPSNFADLSDLSATLWIFSYVTHIDLFLWYESAKNLAEVNRVEDPISKENTMQAHR